LRIVFQQAVGEGRRNSLTDGGGLLPDSQVNQALKLNPDLCDNRLLRKTKVVNVDAVCAGEIRLRGKRKWIKR
jgi:hypothetical protein